MSKIAYIVQKFPSLTITFIYREIMTLRARGLEIAAFSTWKPRRSELSQEAVDLMGSTFYIFPLDKIRFLCHRGVKGGYLLPGFWSQEIRGRHQCGKN